MSDQIDLKPIQDKLTEKGSILILFGPNATVDHVAASLALYLILKEQNKDVFVASPAELRAEFSRLVGLDKISQSIGNRNLVISFQDYDPGSIDKISHNDGAGNKFELIIQPKSGSKAPDPGKIDYSYRGAEANLIFIIGTQRLEDLGSIYESERKLFNDTTIVAFNRRQAPTYAAISVLDNQASSLCEIVAEFIEKLGLNAKDDIASNLLAGIDFATNRFQNPVISPAAFLMAGKLVQNGARRQPPRIVSSTPFTPPVINSRPFGQFPQNPDNSPFAAAMAASGVTQPINPSPTRQPINLQPQQNPAPNESPAAATDNPPPDWLQPKIYKGSTRV